MSSTSFMQQTARFWRRVWRAASSGRLLQTGAPWLRQRGLPLPMSPTAYAFDRFKRQRRTMIPTADLAKLYWTCEPGLVSVVLPAYNGEEFLSAALDSILAQTYPHWELVAVDDGSTDSTGAILDRYNQADRRIRVIHQENRKLPGALSTGFSLARGEFLTWTSCDNLLYPDFLERMVGCLQSRPAWDMVYANLDIVAEDGTPLRGSDWYRSYQIPLDSEHIRLPRDPAELNTRPDNYLGAAFLYRRRAAGLLGEYSPLRYTIEDYDYWMRLNALLHLRHAGFPEPVYAYRFHRKSLTSQDKELAITEQRNRLTIYDSFRRDFYLSPLLWQVVASSTPISAETARSFQAMIERCGHQQIHLEQYDPESLPRFWFPVVFVYFNSASEVPPPPPEHLPSSALKAIVFTGDEPAVKIASGWDLAVRLGHEVGAAPQSNITPTVMEASSISAPIMSAPIAAAGDAETLFSALDIWARSRHLADYEREALQPPTPRYKISVVICTYKRPDRLAEALASVAGQTMSRQDFEVIIVDNDPQTRSLEALIQEWRNQHFAGNPENLRLVYCPVVGLAYARNAGISEARGEVICFLDDDAVAAPDWLARIWEAFETDPQAGVVGGKILLRKPDPSPRWLLPGWEVYWSHFDPPYSGFTRVDHWSRYPWGANWSARRMALLEVGGFPTRGFGRQGTKVQDGEEIAVAALIQQMGYTIGVEPRAVVAHHVDPARFTLGFVFRKIILGRRRWYESQVDLYLPQELGFRHSLRRIAAAFNAAVKPLSLSALLKTLYILFAEGLVFFWYLRDLLLRLRRPMTIG